MHGPLCVNGHLIDPLSTHFLWVISMHAPVFANLLLASKLLCLNLHIKNTLQPWHIIIMRKPSLTRHRFTVAFRLSKSFGVLVMSISRCLDSSYRDRLSIFSATILSLTLSSWCIGDHSINFSFIYRVSRIAYLRAPYFSLLTWQCNHGYSHRCMIGSIRHAGTPLIRTKEWHFHIQIKCLQIN